MFRQILFVFFATAMTALAQNVTAAELSLIPIMAIEAKTITVDIQGAAGRVTAEGCQKCPIRADIDADTRFYLRKQAVSHRNAESLSGNGGTIVYSADRVVEIIWSSGSLK